MAQTHATADQNDERIGNLSDSNNNHIQNIASVATPSTLQHQENEQHVPHEIEENHSMNVSMTMIASTLLLRIPMEEAVEVDDDDDDGDVDHDEAEKEDHVLGDSHKNDAVVSKVPNAQRSKSNNTEKNMNLNTKSNNKNSHNMAQQLAAWLDHYHHTNDPHRTSSSATLKSSHTPFTTPSYTSSNSNSNSDSRNSRHTAPDVSTGNKNSNTSTTSSSTNTNHGMMTMIHLTSTECHHDFLYLYQCRQHLRVLLQHISDHYRTYQTIQNISYPENFKIHESSTSSNSNSSRNRGSDNSRTRPKTRDDQNFESKQQHQEPNSNSKPFIEYAMEELQHYFAVLQEFIHQGFPANENDGLDFLSLTWYCPIMYEEDQKDDDENEKDAPVESKNTRFYETHYSLSWECINVLYNIAVLYSYRSSATLENHSDVNGAVAGSSPAVPTRAQWTKAGQYLQNAATIVRYVRHTYYAISTTATAAATTMTHINNQQGELVLTSLSNHTNSNHSIKTTSTTATHSGIIWYNSVLLCNSKFLEVLQLHLLAEAQRAAYQTFVATNLQSHSTQLPAAGPSTNSATGNDTVPPVSSLSTVTTKGISTTPPKHFVLAKLAAAAAPLYLAVEDLCQGNNNQECDNSSEPSEEEYDDDDEKYIINEDNREGKDKMNAPELDQAQEHSSSQSGPSSAMSMTPSIPQEQAKVDQWSTTRFIQEWEDSVRAYGMWMTTLAEYHQSWVHRKRNTSTSAGSGGSGSHSTTEHGMEIARLECALKFADYCRDFCESTNVHTVQLLLPQIKQLVQEMEERFDTAKLENDQHFHDTVPEHDELPEISQVLSVKTDLENISKLLPSLNPERVTLFANVLDPKLRIYVDMFRTKVQKVIIQTEQLANRQTEIAREQLAAINLPHSITTYRQQENGGGLPNDIWDRILPLQENNTVEQFTREVWSIRKLSDTANDMLQLIHEQLVDILEIDTVFRQTNSQFVGHDVQQIQKIFRPILQTYDQALLSARTSDDLLMKRCDVFDTDPKFRLLKLPKSQLDRLFPLIKSTEHNLDEDDGNMYDTNTLRNLLVELSKLFNHRETIIHSIYEHSKTYDISKELLNRGSNVPDVTYQQIVDMALTSLHPLVNEIRMNLEKQGKLLYKISSENEQFVKMRNNQAQRRVASKVSMQGGPIVKIYDALEEVESFKQHILQGKEFYDIVIPKLQKLHEQVNDVSGRLAKERMEYEKLPRRSQRLSHARDNDVEQSLQSRYNRHSSRFDTRNSDGYNDTVGASNHHNLTSRPDISPSPQRNFTDRTSQPSTTTRHHEPISQPETQFYVDDEKVASLVSMDFDPVKAVAALKRHNNDLELALNELLVG